MHDARPREGHSVSVAAILVDDAGRVLAIRRRDTGAWQPPGGVLEPDEAIEDGLVREVYEETRLVVMPCGITGLYKHVDLGILALVFRCTVDGGELQPTEEAKDVCWLTLREVDAKMDEVFAVRVRDALDYDRRDPNVSLPVRNHDGRTLVGTG